MHIQSSHETFTKEPLFLLTITESKGHIVTSPFKSNQYVDNEFLIRRPTDICHSLTVGFHMLVSYFRVID